MNAFQAQIDNYESILIHGHISSAMYDAVTRGRLTLIEVGQLTKPVAEVVDQPESIVPWWGFAMENNFCPCGGRKS